MLRMASVANRVSTKVGGFLGILKKTAPRTYYTYVNEPSQPIKGKQPKWVCAEEAFECLKSGNNFYKHYCRL